MAGATEYARVSLRRYGGSYRYEHIAIAEKALGKPLPNGTEVHHVNEQRRDNRPTNLVMCQDHAYHMLLHRRARVLRAGGDPGRDLVCGRCRHVKLREAFSPNPSKSVGRMDVCRECRRKGRPAPTTCKRGHPWTEENSYWRPDNPRKRNCWECIRMRTRGQHRA